MARALEGRTVAVTGTLKTMKRADAHAKLERLGATVAKSLSKKVDILVAGEKAGSKLLKAEQLGVGVRDEAWLVALVAGETGEPEPAPALAPIEGPLADWVARLEALAERLRKDPRVNVTFRLGEPIPPATLARIESSWKVDAFEPAIRNVYRQANGVCLLWISTHHPNYERVRKHWRKSDLPFVHGVSHMPSPREVDGFAGVWWEGPGPLPGGTPPWGAIYLPPLERVAGRSGGLFQTNFDTVPSDEERRIAGKTWRGSDFEDALRVFDYPNDFCPAAWVMEEGVSAPPVVLADDHTNWASGRYASFESYMEHVLGTLGTTQARMDWFDLLHRATDEPVGSPRSLALDELLPPSVELVPAADGATFEVRVEAVEGQGGGGEDPRVVALAKLIPGHRVKNVAKVLGLGPYNRKNEAFLPEIAAATADPKAIDAKTAAKLMGAANQRKKTKGAFLEAFAVGMGAAGEGETLTLRVTTCFDRSSLSAEDLDWSFGSEQIVKEWLAALGLEDPEGAWVACEVAEAKGRKERTAKVVVTLARPSGLEVGQSARSSVVPVGFRELGTQIVRSIR